MAKAYWVVSYRAIHKPEAFARYAAVAPAAVQANGGRFLVRGMAAEVHEAGIQQRVVVIEFDTLAQALAAPPNLIDRTLQALALDAVGRHQSLSAPHRRQLCASK